MCLGSLSFHSNSSSYLWYYLPAFLRKKVWFARTPQCIQILGFAQGFSHPFEAAEIFSDSLHLSLSNHGMGTENFVCLSRLFSFFFFAFLFFFQIMASQSSGCLRTSFPYRTASASQGRGYSGSKKSLGPPSKPKLKITSLKIWLSLLPSNNPLFGGGRKLPLYSAYGPFTLKDVLACPLTPKNATARKRVFIIWF